MPIWSVIVLLGQPWQAPWKRIWTTPAVLTSTSSMSPPSAWTAGRIRLMTFWTRSRTVPPEGVCVAVDIAFLVRVLAGAMRRGIIDQPAASVKRRHLRRRFTGQALPRVRGSGAAEEVHRAVERAVIEAAVHALPFGRDADVGRDDRVVIEQSGLDHAHALALRQRTPVCQ